MSTDSHRNASTGCPPDGESFPGTLEELPGGTVPDGEALWKTNQLLERLLSNIHVLIAYLDKEFYFIRVNHAYAAAEGREPGFYVGRNHFDLFPSEENEAIFRRVIETGEPYVAHEKPFQYPGHPERGVTYWDWSLVPVREDSGEVSGLIFALLDVTSQTIAAIERERVQNALRESERSLREKTEEQKTILDNILIGIALLRDRKAVWCNSTMEKLLGYDRHELNGMSTEIVYPSAETFLCVGKEAYPVLRRGETYTAEMPLRRKDGSLSWYSTTGKAIDPADLSRGYIWIVQDISVRRQAEEELLRAKEGLENRVIDRTAELLVTKESLEAEIARRAAKEEETERALREKETLLKELYHRTKNNMTVISSLISLQTRAISDPVVLQMFRDLRNRISSMSLVHEKLYQSRDLSNVNLRDYVSGLANSLLASYGVKAGQVSLRLEIGCFTLSFDAITPCGLVINELISNSLKYAFPSGREGEIRIGCSMTADGDVRLTYSDTGAGFPEGFDLIRSTQTLGLKLVSRLVEGQLDGRVELKTGPGSEFLITFREPHYTRRI